MDKEFYILNYIQNHFRTDFLDRLMPVISFMGKLSLLWVILAAVCLLIKKTRPLGRSLTIDLMFNLIGATLIIKPIVSRVRPCVLNDTVDLLVNVPFDASFPSGHTLYAFGAATIIFIYNKWLGIAAFLFAFLMGFSRLYLYVHFPSDVAFGAVFGVVFAVVAYRLENMLFEKDKPIFRLKRAQNN